MMSVGWWPGWWQYIEITEHYLAICVCKLWTCGGLEFSRSIGDCGRSLLSVYGPYCKCYLSISYCLHFWIILVTWGLWGLRKPLLDNFCQFWWQARIQSTPSAEKLFFILCDSYASRPVIHYHIILPSGTLFQTLDLEKLHHGTSIVAGAVSRLVDRWRSLSHYPPLCTLWCVVQVRLR